MDQQYHLQDETSPEAANISRIAASSNLAANELIMPEYIRDLTASPTIFDHDQTVVFEQIGCADSTPFIQSAVEPLLSSYRAASLHYRRRVRSAIHLNIAGAVAVTLVDIFVVIRALWNGSDVLPFPLIITTWVLYGLILLAGVVAPQGWLTERNRLRDILAESDDIRAIGSLAEKLNVSEEILRQAASAALTVELPRLTTDHIDLLTQEQRETLSNVLRGSIRGDIELKLAILKAFEQIGDVEELKLVERLADSSVRGSRQKRIRRAAKECLPVLKARVDREQSCRTLLRPAMASPSTDPLNHLLKPSSQFIE